MKKTSFLGIILIMLAIACTDVDPCGFIPGDEIQTVDLVFERLEGEIFNLKTPEKVASFMDKHPIIRDEFFRLSDYPDSAIFVNDLAKRFNNPYIDTLRMEVEEHFKDINWLEKEFEKAFSYLKYYYPDIQLPIVQTVATGFDYDMFVSDSLIIVGLDYYMGPEARFRPTQTYNYILKRYDKEFILPSVMLLYGISGKINVNDESDETVLSDMVTYGKSFYFAKRMLPCVPDSTLIWYSSEEMKNVREYDHIAWAHFLENQLLYETSHLVKRKYIDERPQTYEITQFKAPPRIGTWLGWEIVDQYMEKNPVVTLKELMQTSDVQKIFQGSAYKPKKD